MHALELLELLRQDLKATGLSSHIGWVAAAAENVADFATDQGSFVQKVVDDVQQRLQDLFVALPGPPARVIGGTLDYSDGRGIVRVTARKWPRSVSL